MAPPNLFRRSFALSIAVAFILMVVFGLQSNGPWWEAWTIQPLNIENWRGFLLGPLLHGSSEHLLNNIFGVVVLGTLSGSLYGKTTAYTLPIIWISAFLTTWGFGQPFSHHLGISGITYGLMALIVTLGLLRRDRPSIAALFVVVMFFGASVWGLFPTDGISASGHAGGVFGGIVGSLVFSRSAPPKEHKIVWEDDDVSNEEETDYPSPPLVWYTPPQTIDLEKKP